MRQTEECGDSFPPGFDPEITYCGPRPHWGMLLYFSFNNVKRFFTSPGYAANGNYFIHWQSTGGRSRVLLCQSSRVIPSELQADYAPGF
jgi:hypothetical protein